MDLPYQGIELGFPALQLDSLPPELLEKPFKSLEKRNTSVLIVLSSTYCFKHIKITCPFWIKNFRKERIDFILENVFGFKQCCLPTSSAELFNILKKCWDLHGTRADPRWGDGGGLDRLKVSGGREPSGKEGFEEI